MPGYPGIPDPAYQRWVLAPGFNPEEFKASVKELFRPLSHEVKG